MWSRSGQWQDWWYNRWSCEAAVVWPCGGRTFTPESAAAGSPRLAHRYYYTRVDSTGPSTRHGYIPLYSTGTGLGLSKRGPNRMNLGLGFNLLCGLNLWNMKSGILVSPELQTIRQWVRRQEKDRCAWTCAGTAWWRVSPVWQPSWPKTSPVSPCQQRACTQNFYGNCAGRTAGRERTASVAWSESWNQEEFPSPLPSHNRTGFQWPTWRQFYIKTHN